MTDRNQITTIADIYAAINPLPAVLSAKGNRSPDVRFEIRANANVNLTIDWVKPGAQNDWDRAYHLFNGDTFEEALGKATAFIADLPDADTSRLRDFMGRLGNLIDHGRSLGIAVDFLNPLTETMKRLSENVITHQPKAGGANRSIP